MNDDKGYRVVQTIKNFLGNPKSEIDDTSRNQWQFNCPTPKCRADQDKFNLEYNSGKNVFKCWKCKYYGFVYTLANDYGSSQDLDRIKTILPPSKNKKFKDNSRKKPRADHHLVTCNLPEGYMPLGQVKSTNLYRLAWNYLTGDRHVSPEIIDKYQIGYTENGNRRFRIIIPSKNSFKRFNYYEARSYMKDPDIPYIKPSGDEVHKNDIIFNESNINWDIPVFLVEGVFDMFRVPNGIPVLGKEASPLLVSLLLKHNATVILCFDPDAFEQTVETYTLLSSLGLDVFFVDLTSYGKDISKIYEDHGRLELAKALRGLKKLDLPTEIKGKLKE